MVCLALRRRSLHFVYVRIGLLTPRPMSVPTTRSTPRPVPANWVCARQPRGSCLEYRKFLSEGKVRYAFCCSGCRSGNDHTRHCMGYVEGKAAQSIVAFPNARQSDFVGFPESLRSKRKESACDEYRTKRSRICGGESQCQKDLRTLNLKGDAYVTEKLIRINATYLLEVQEKLPPFCVVGREEVEAAYDRLLHSLMEEESDQD